MEAYHAIWKDEGLRGGFEAKTPASFFESERRFIVEIGADVSSVLDIGCASGRLIELLSSLGWNGRFVGVDIIEENIAAATRLYPQHRFSTGDAVTMSWAERFDLVNATGVMQHEPRFEALIRNMAAHANRHVLFDVKLGPVDDHLIDIERSYCQVGDARAFFICLCFPKFLDFLKSLEGVRAIRVFGYPTPFNKTTTVPDTLTQWISAGVLLEIGAGGLERVEIDLPPPLASSGEGGA